MCLHMLKVRNETLPWQWFSGGSKPHLSEFTMRDACMLEAGIFFLNF